MRPAGFDDPKDPALFDAQQDSGLGDRQHRFSAFRTIHFFRRCLSDEESPFGYGQLFKLPRDLHISFIDKKLRFGDGRQSMIFGQKSLDFFWIFLGYFLDIADLRPISGPK